MELNQTKTLGQQFKDVEMNINERTQEISHIIQQHNIPVECFDIYFNLETYDFESDVVKNAYHSIIQYQREIQEQIKTYCILRDRLVAEKNEIGIEVVNAQAVKMAIAKAYLMIVVNHVKRATSNIQEPDLIELIHEGNIGLMKAIDKYDHQNGYKFPTFASWWIRPFITRYIAAAKSDENVAS